MLLEILTQTIDKSPEEEKNNHIEEFVLLVFSDKEIEEEGKPAEEYTD